MSQLVWIYWPNLKDKSGWYQAKKVGSEYVYTKKWIKHGQNVIRNDSDSARELHGGRFKKINSTMEGKLSGEYVTNIDIKMQGKKVGKKVGKKIEVKANKIEFILRGLCQDYLQKSCKGSMHISIPRKDIDIIRELFKTSLRNEIESCGAFSCKYQNDCKLRLQIDPEKTKAGLEMANWTACAQEEDFPFTFHTHHIVYNKDGDQVFNNPMLYSDEDLIGLVQDSYANDGILSNKTGMNVFDLLATPMGLFVCGANKKIIKEWKSREPKRTTISQQELEDIFKKNKSWKYQWKKKGWKWDNPYPKVPLTKPQKEWLFYKLYWGHEENAFNHKVYNDWFGSYANREEPDTQYFEIEDKFAHLGYGEWHDEEVTNVEWRHFAPKVEQLEWFDSQAMLDIDWNTDEMLQRYLSHMRNLGFQILFFNWNDNIEFNWNVV